MTIQQSPFLRQQRSFPDDNIQALTVEIDRSYIDIATKMNSRTIGTFALGTQIVTGEEWYLTGQTRRQQTLRQLYTGSGTGSFAHGINFNTLTAFTRIYGTFTNGSGWFPLPYVDVSAVVNQVSLAVNATNIVIATGAGSSTVVDTWYVVLEWLSQY